MPEETPPEREKPPKEPAPEKKVGRITADYVIALEGGEVLYLDEGIDLSPREDTTRIPKTGDESHPFLAILGMLISGGMIAGILVNRSRRGTAGEEKMRKEVKTKGGIEEQDEEEQNKEEWDEYQEERGDEWEEDETDAGSEEELWN